MTTQRAVARLLELMRQRTGAAPVHAAVMHADAAEEAEAVRSTHRGTNSIPWSYSLANSPPVLGAHTGPGLLCIAFWAEDAPPGTDRVAQ